MKELKKFYDSLSDSSKRTLALHAEDYFEPENADGYKIAKVKDITVEYAIVRKAEDTYGDFTSVQWSAAGYILQTLPYDQMKEILFNRNRFTGLYDRGYLRDTDRDILLLLKPDDYREAIKKDKQMRNGWDDEDFDRECVRDAGLMFLYNKDYTKKGLQELFDKLFEMRVVNGRQCEILNDKTFCLEVFGRNNMLKLCKECPDYIEIISEYQQPYHEAGIFDELFFCNNGWDDSTKNRMINNLNINTVGRFELFVKRILSVDMSYIKFLPNILAQYCINEIINQKKPEASSINSTLSRSEAPRYNKKFRTLLRALYACMSEKLVKTRAAQLKEVAPLIQLYGFDFNCICEALYPEAFEETA